MNPKCSACRRPGDRPCGAVDWIWPEVAPHRRFCELMATDPGSWGPIIEERSEMPRPEPLPVQQEWSASRHEAVEQSLNELLPCPHRTGRWSCCETIVFCALNKGQEGIVDRSDCAGCDVPKGLIRLGYVTNGFEVGGAERHMLQVMEAAGADSFVWVGVACPFPNHKVGGDILERIQKRCPVGIGPKSVQQLSMAVDVLLVWGVPRWPGMLDPRAKCKTILIAHGHSAGDVTCNAEAMRADAIVAVAKAAIGSLPLDQQPRTRVIYNTGYAKPAATGRDAVRKAWGISSDGDKVLGTLGRLAFDKNTPALPAAVASLPSSWIGVGVGPNLDDLSADRVIYPGSTDDPGSALGAFDAMLFPSPEEGCGIALIEAWAARVPVVSTPVGLALEYPDLVRGIPIDADGPTIAAAVLEDQLDAEGTASRVERAHAFATTELSSERFGERWRELLTTVAKGRPNDPPVLDWTTFITVDRLARDATSMVPGLPSDIDMVMAIPRSGIVPGAAISYALHKPLWTVSRQSGVLSPGGGFRIDDNPDPKHILLIDDTAATGREMKACFPIVRERFPNAKISKAAVYALPTILHTLDFCAASYDVPHFLEWNFANSFHAETGAFDMDGILCRDFTHEECETDETYRAAMRTISPLYLPRRAPIPLIVTARPESTRDLTLEWLDRYEVKVIRLIMRDFECDMSQPHTQQIGEWKARHYAVSPCHLFVESDPGQAQIIAAQTGKPVLCPAMGRLLPGRVLISA